MLQDYHDGLPHTLGVVGAVGGIGMSGTQITLGVKSHNTSEIISGAIGIGLVGGGIGAGMVGIRNFNGDTIPPSKITSKVQPSKAEAQASAEQSAVLFDMKHPKLYQGESDQLPMINTHPQDLEKQSFDSTKLERSHDILKKVCDHP